MIEALPFSEIYNLSRLGQAGDEITFFADDDARAAIARWSQVQAVERFALTARLKKRGSNHYEIEADLDVYVVQACVATLAPVPGHIARRFTRELYFTGVRRTAPAATAETVLSLEEGPEPPEEIESLHYDLAAPALEEYVLGLDPYPRAPGAEFTPQLEASDAVESPFAVLKRLKDRP